MTVIDAHIHLYDEPDYLDRLLTAMDKHGIEKCCLSGLGDIFGQAGNDDVRAAFLAHSDRVIGAFYIRPGIDGPDKIDRAYEEGFRMIKVSLPRGPYDDQAFFPLWAKALARRMPVLFHTGVITCRESPGESISSWNMHPLSFKGEAERLFFSRLDDSCELRSEQVIFPDKNNIDNLAGLIDGLGGIDTCYGGIGIHGHVAFNEPEHGVKDTHPRLVTLNDFTVTINAVRSGVGGNLECFPRSAYTLGMRQILAAERIRLYCRNGCEFDWANTVLRLALFGEPGDDYPVTHIRDRNYTIITDENTLSQPKNLL